MFCQQVRDFFGCGTDFFYGDNVIQDVDDAGDVFAHFGGFVPGAADEFRGTVG